MSVNPRPPRPDTGATAVEYALILALVAAVIIVGVTAFGGSVLGLYQTSCSALVGAAGHGTC